MKCRPIWRSNSARRGDCEASSSCGSTEDSNGKLRSQHGRCGLCCATVDASRPGGAADERPRQRQTTGLGGGMAGARRSRCRVPSRRAPPPGRERKSVVEGKGGASRVGQGGPGLCHKKTEQEQEER